MISGTPTRLGQFTFVLKVLDAICNADGASGYHTYTLDVGTPAAYTLQIDDGQGGVLVAGQQAHLTVTPWVNLELDPFTVSTILPGGFSPGTASGTGYSCHTAGQEVTCTYTPGSAGVTGSLPPLDIPVTVGGGARTATITSTVSSADGAAVTANDPVTVGVLGVSASPSILKTGDDVTLSATGLPSTSSGTVTFSDSSGQELCRANLPDKSCTVTANASGSQDITALYTYDPHEPPLSAATSFTVESATDFAVTVTPAPAPYGTAVKLSYLGLGGDGSGTLTFTDSADGKTLCTVEDAQSSGSCKTEGDLRLGHHRVSVLYGGDPTLPAFNIPAMEDFEVTQAPTAINAAAAHPSIAYGTGETLQFGGLPAGAGGKVTFASDGTTLCTVTDVTKASSCTTSKSLDPASYDVTATYSGDADYKSSNATTGFEVTKAPVTGFAATATPSPAAAGSTLTLGFTGLPADAGGKVTFASGGTTLCTITDVTAASTCQYQTSASLVTGSYDVSASYGGDANYEGATAATQVRIVSQGTGSVGPTPPAVTRLGGANRILTAVAVSKASFADQTAGAVVLARSDEYADALAGTALAAAHNAPLLLTAPDALTPATRTELQRVLPAGKTVYLLGGTDALGKAVADQLETLGYDVVRLAGKNRYATAAAIARALGNPKTILLATGKNFPDALAAGDAAAAVHGVVLFTAGRAMSSATAAYLAAHPGPTVRAVGGPACAAETDVGCLMGANRYGTAAAVATQLFNAPTGVGVATGQGFPDALSAGAWMGRLGFPILLSRQGALPSTTTDYLAHHATVQHANVFGGTDALGQNVVTGLKQYVG